MRKPTRLLFGAIVCAASNSASAQHVERSTVLGTLTGISSQQRPLGVQLYGTDLGWTFEHQGKLQVLLGDSWFKPNYLCSVLCDGFLEQDDTQGYLPTVYTEGVPALTLATKADAPTEVATTRLYRDSQLLRTSQNAGPMTAFSDGEHAIAMYQATTYAECAPSKHQSGGGTCPESFVCANKVGVCQPQVLGVPTLCELGAWHGCSVPGQTCRPVGAGFCVDASTPLADVAQRTALELEVAEQRPDEPTSYDSRHTFYSNKFINMTARTVRGLSELGQSDYGPGHGDLLLWGRPGFTSDHSNNKPLYLLTHELPFEHDAHGAIEFHPRYFSGLDRTGRPQWSENQADATPLSLDGEPNGDPREVLPVLNQLTVTWLDAPIQRWVMFYGGDSPLNLTGPATAAVGGTAPGAVVVRYAEHPWGPWSAPETLLAPGTPDVEGSLYGPGGILYHPACFDRATSSCARSDPARYSALLRGSCAPEYPSPDYGLLYAAGIIEPYTKRTSAGFDVYWTASTWNPYVTIFVRSTIAAGK